MCEVEGGEEEGWRVDLLGNMTASSAASIRFVGSFQRCRASPFLRPGCVDRAKQLELLDIVVDAKSSIDRKSVV